jgi:ABC-type amino acid transport substrate-binding protein
VWSPDKERDSVPVSGMSPGAPKGNKNALKHGRHLVTLARVHISGPGDLARARVAAVSGTGGAEWLIAQGIAARTYPFVIQAIKALQRGDVQAPVYERAILGHMIKEYNWNELQILPHTLAVRYYAIAVPTGASSKSRSTALF